MKACTREIAERRLDLISLRESIAMTPPRPIVFGDRDELLDIEHQQIDTWIRRSRLAYRSEPVGVEIGGEA